MEELKKYSDEELREELKRRGRERMIASRKEIRYIEFEATIKSIDNVRNTWGGVTRYLPFSLWRFNIKDSNHRLKSVEGGFGYKLKANTFKKDTAPQVGDRVLLRYRDYKCSGDIFNARRATIIKIIKQ